MMILLCLYSCCCLVGAPARAAQYGLASYYGADFHGKKTASGELFDQRALTCAHRDLPFGTRVKVTNSRNNKWVIVRVNDRGPWVGGRVIDLSYAAAEKIGMIEDGIVKVKIELAR
jgi:rare lipoprotein A